LIQEGIHIGVNYFTLLYHGVHFTSTIASVNKSKSLSLFAILMPGILVAATGVGAGDLATASFSGSQLGLTILWAVVVGGLLKFTLTEGLARWQLVTGTSFLEGVEQHFGRVTGWLFLPYLLLWTFFVASALMSACGATLHAMFPIFDAATDKIAYGILCSLVGSVRTVVS
jgi:Mn2+/Fe2+ NRAMP family transporter